MPLAKGARVRQVMPAVEGEILERRFDDATDAMQYLVAYHGADGEPSQRWFSDAELEEVPQ